MRLIDANYMKEHIEGRDSESIKIIKEWIDNQPTIEPQRTSDDETCDSCRYRYNEWDEDPCDGCTPADSGYCPDSIELQPPILIEATGMIIDGYTTDAMLNQQTTGTSYSETTNPPKMQDLPSVQPQRWVPVSEALPKDDEEVIVTCLDDSGDTPFSYTTVAWHYNGMWVCENERCPFVVAWMPLPPSYKGGQDE